MRVHPTPTPSTPAEEKVAFTSITSGDALSAEQVGSKHQVTLDAAVVARRLDAIERRLAVLERSAVRPTRAKTWTSEGATDTQATTTFATTKGQQLPELPSKLELVRVGTSAEERFEELQSAGRELDLQQLAEADGDPLAVEEVPLEGTVWDCVLLVGMSGGVGGGLLLSPVQTVAVVLLGLLNLCLQVICIWGIGGTMAASSPLNPTVQESILNERLLDNHHMANIDPTTVTSKAALLCAQGVYNRMGQLQGDVADYLDDTLSGFKAGEVVSSIAMIIWILNITAELQRIFCLASTIAHLRPASDGIVENLVVNESVDGYNIVMMSASRKFSLFFFVLLPRLILAVTLLHYGLKWLAGTVAVSDLILNACALEIVSQIDEALFLAALAGIFKIDRFTFEPRTHSCRSGAGRMAREAALFVFPCLFIAGFYLLARLDTLAGFVGQVEIVSDYMCSRDTNFVFDSHGMMGLPVFADLTLSNAESVEPSRNEQLKCFYAATRDLVAIRAGFPPTWMKADEAMQGQILGTHSNCTRQGGEVLCPSVTLEELHIVSALSFDSYFRSDTYCVDQTVHMTAIHEVCTHSEFSDVTSSVFTGRVSCEDFADFCACPLKDQQGLCEANETTYEDVMLEFNVTYPWIEVLQSICPQSCDMCVIKPDMPGSKDGPAATPDKAPAPAAPPDASPDAAPAPVQHGQGSAPAPSQTPGPSEQGPADSEGGQSDAATTSPSPSPPSAPSSDGGQGTPKASLPTPSPQDQETQGAQSTPAPASTPSAAQGSPGSSPSQGQAAQGAP